MKKLLEVNDELFERLRRIQWFSRCGSIDEIRFPVQWTVDLNTAVVWSTSEAWQDVRTEAQGDLTGYLSKHHTLAYSEWNNLAKESRRRIEIEIEPSIRSGLEHQGLSLSLTTGIIVDINRSVLEGSYARLFPAIPRFFEKIFELYESGHFPCGWNGELNSWPSGEIIAF